LYDGNDIESILGWNELDRFTFNGDTGKDVALEPYSVNQKKNETQVKSQFDAQQQVIVQNKSVF